MSTEAAEIVEELPAEVEAPAAEAPAAVDEAPAAEAQAEAEELVVTLGDETPESEQVPDDNAAPAWLKNLRKQNRELVKEKRELERRLQQAQPPKAAVVLGPKPTLADLDYDEEQYGKALESWHERKIQVEAEAREAQKTQEAQTQAWQKRLQGYEQQKMALRVPNFEAAEESVRGVLSEVQQSLLIKACKQPALMVAAFGNNERKLRELAAITDPVDFVAEIVRAEAQVKTQSRKPATQPENKVPPSSMSGAAAIDNELERLRAQAAKTGDRTPVVRYLAGKAKQAA